ncbi:sugar ABC transporter ATP-binding protein [Sinorhizobium sp. BG8]|uniref:sugar ABC transporter ATP-binding protein n=1 Tax=Sinorhizobium sp. BG8 TaxID=2613773 RepID=UPI00193CF7CC|nr:sugar ABC transporter ATP-binding protein [Sinorhizobium sp. BG8]QRM57800.1 sugar ABC transporter ATP-binding protein [Sinorhizobium sp. BG8]
MNIRSSPPAVPLAPVFQASGLSKSYGPNIVIEDIAFEIPDNQVVTLVGENGAGKSTIFNIMSGLVSADRGSMTLHGRDYAPKDYAGAVALGVSRVFQEQALVQNIPVYENLLLGQDQRFLKLAQIVDKSAMITAAERIIEEAGIDVDVRRRTGDYDFSKRQSIEIARACLAPTLIGGAGKPLVLLDEPTSALDRRDEEAFFKLVAKVRTRGSLLFVSHRLSEVLQISDLIYVLKDGRLVAKLDPASTDEHTLHGLMVGRERAMDYYFEKRQKTVTNAAKVLAANGVRVSELDPALDLSIREGEVVGIGGLLDSGKSALGKAIAGVDPPLSGKVEFAGSPAIAPDIKHLVRAGLGYVAAERLVEGIVPAFSVSWNLTTGSGSDLFSTRLGFWRRRKEVEVTRQFVKSLGIRSATPDLACARLSGGNQQKVVLARWLARQPKVLILDNPTRGVDAGAKQEIYRLIRDLTDQGVGILLITDELLELIGLSNRILIMQRGNIVSEVPASPDAKPTEHQLVALMLPQGGDEPGFHGREAAKPHSPVAENVQ